jgi:hypothetical protein
MPPPGSSLQTFGYIFIAKNKQEQGLPALVFEN